MLAALYREIEADKSPREGKRLYLLGQVAELVDKRKAALAWYREVPEDDEHAFEAQMRVALVLDQLDRTPEALDHFGIGWPASPLETPSSSAMCGCSKPICLARRQRTADALAVYDKALANLPDDARLLYARALLIVDHGDATGGERDLRRVLQLKPDDAEALNALGYTLADHSKDDARQHEALELIQHALKLKPDEAAIMDSMGWVRYRLGDLDASLENLRRAYAKQPDPDIAAHLGEVLWARGQHDEARRIWDEGRKKDARNKALIGTIRRLTQ